MTVYLGIDRQCTAQHLTATHATVSEVTKKVQGHGHKLYMDNYFSSPDLCDDLATKIFTVVALSDPTGRACHRTLAP